MFYGLGETKEDTPPKPSEIKQAESVKTFNPSLTPRDTEHEISLIDFLKNKIKKIIIYGFPFTQMPAGTNMVKMLNISNLFKNYGYIDEYYHSIFLTGLTMISARKYVQSVEFFRNIQRYIFNILHNIPDDICHSPKVTGELNSTRKREFTTRNDNCNAQKLESSSNYSALNDSVSISDSDLKRLLYRAAKLEILIADCCSQHSQLQEKLEAFK